MTEQATAANVDGAATRRIMNVFRAIIRALNVDSRALELSTGLSLAQAIVLRELSDRPAASLGELATRTATHLSSVSVVVRRLQEKGFVDSASASQDRRRKEFAITEQGVLILRRATRTVLAELVEALRAFDEPSREELAGLLESLRGAAGIEAVTPMSFEETS